MLLVTVPHRFLEFWFQPPPCTSHVTLSKSLSLDSYTYKIGIIIMITPPQIADLSSEADNVYKQKIKVMCEANQEIKDLNLFNA